MRKTTWNRSQKVPDEGSTLQIKIANFLTWTQYVPYLGSSFSLATKFVTSGRYFTGSMGGRLIALR